jgi:hypothetical protein
MTEEQLLGCAAVHASGKTVVVQHYSLAAVAPKPVQK